MLRNKYFYLYFENPLKTYWKARKYFKPLKLKCWFGKSFSKYKVLDAHCFDVCWKSKWNTPRHEYNPKCVIVLFNKWELSFWWEYLDGEGKDKSMEYWESILWFVYYKKSLQDSVRLGTGWSTWDEDKQAWVKQTYDFLKEPYQTMYNENKLKDIFYESTTR